jgi:hypothetical protein
MSFAVGVAETLVAEWMVQGAYAGQLVLNRGHWTVNNNTVAEIPSGLYLTWLQDQWKVNILPRLNDEYRVVWFIIKTLDVINVNPPRFTYLRQDVRAGDANDVGTRIVTGMPAFVSATAQLSTGFLGRSAHGSKRFAPVMEEDTGAGSANALTDAALGFWQTAVQDFYKNPLPITGLGQLNHVVASAVKGAGLAPANPAFWPQWAIPIQSARVNQRLGSQVSRKTRRDLM